jgi:uncharacterized protein (TIGR02145 family)
MMKIINYTILFLLVSILPLSCSKKETSEPITDIDGNIYGTVKIGSQVWMEENLKTTKLNDGTAIPLIKDSDDWIQLSGSGYCWYNNEEASFKDLYGALYNGYTVETGKICPDGWHLPSVEEWQTLADFGEDLKAGGALKDAGTEHWLAPNKGGTNSSGFTALPAGLRYFEGTFAADGTFTGYWSANESENEIYYAGLYHSSADVVIDHKNKKHGLSIRCLKN